MKNVIIKEVDEIPKDAVKIHLYDVKNVLMPRGSMKKESIAIYLLEQLKSYYESWTNSDYNDNPTIDDLIKFLHKNLTGEVEKVWLSFLSDISVDKSFIEKYQGMFTNIHS